VISVLKRLVVVFAAFGLVVAACGGGSSSCEDIANETVDLVQSVIDDLDQMSPEEIAGQGEGGPGFLAEFDEQAEKLADDAASAGCTDEEMSELIKEQAGSLTAESELGKLFVDLVNSGEFLGL
jgi:hypothetical protein